MPTTNRWQFNWPSWFVGFSSGVAAPVDGPMVAILFILGLVVAIYGFNRAIKETLHADTD